MSGIIIEESGMRFGDYEETDVFYIEKSEQYQKTLKPSGIKSCEILLLRNKMLLFIEAKKTSLTLRDLGQLWAYCKLIDPEEAFLLTSADLGSLNKILNIYKREDLLDFGDGKRIKKMKIAVWNMQTNRPDPATMIPKV